jgi:hypothetical protein
MGRLPRTQYIRVLQVSAAHVYLTYPFVLSWSLLEAMACGALVVASDTAPVREVIAAGQNGVLVPFLDAPALANALHAALANPPPARALGARARAAAAGYSYAAGLCGYAAALDPAQGAMGPPEGLPPSIPPEPALQDQGDGPPLACSSMSRNPPRSVQSWASADSTWRTPL